MGKAVQAQQDFWFRNDDGSITAATFMGAQGSNQSISVDTKFRLRVLTEETAGGTGACAAHLFYSYNSGAYTTLTGASTHVQEVDDDNSIADNASSGASAQLTYAGTYLAGRYSDDGAAATNVVISSQYTEFEFCLQVIGTAVANGDTIDFRVYNGTTALDSYTVSPRLTVVKEAAAPRRIFITHL